MVHLETEKQNASLLLPASPLMYDMTLVKAPLIYLKAVKALLFFKFITVLLCAIV